MSKTYESDALGAVHEAMSDAHDVGVVDKSTMRKFDEMCLTPAPSLEATEIRAIRESARVSQAVFAHYLNVSVSVVGQWERGQKKPQGSSLKLLALVKKKGLDSIA